MSKQQVKEPFNEVFISFLGENGFQPSMFGIFTYIWITLLLLYYVLNRLSKAIYSTEIRTGITNITQIRH